MLRGKAFKLVAHALQRMIVGDHKKLAPVVRVERGKHVCHLVGPACGDLCCIKCTLEGLGNLATIEDGCTCQRGFSQCGKLDAVDPAVVAIASPISES